MKYSLWTTTAEWNSFKQQITSGVIIESTSSPTDNSASSHGQTFCLSLPALGPDAQGEKMHNELDGWMNKWFLTRKGLLYCRTQVLPPTPRPPIYETKTEDFLVEEVFNLTTFGSDTYI